MRVAAHPRFRRDLRKVPAEARKWALEWAEAASAPSATLESVCADSYPLKGADLSGWLARKYRRFEQGEYRLVFGANEEEIYILSLDSREDNYRAAARRARGIKKIVVV